MTSAAAGVAVLVVLGLVVVSPLALSAVGAGYAGDWGRLSDIGQTYGATSAVLSALALGGVAVSLLLQARQGRAERIQAIRGLHTDLVKMQLDDLPTYLPCWGPLDLPTDDDRRRHIYTNLLMQYAWMGYEIGTVPEPLLRDMLGNMFRGDVAGRYWPLARTSWVASTGGTRTGRRFLQIVDDEFGRAPATPPVRDDRKDHTRLLAAGAAAAVVAGLIWRRRRAR